MGKFYLHICLFFIICIGLSQISSNNPLKRTDLPPGINSGYDHPPGSRICCAFGYDLHLPVISFFSIANTIKLKTLFNSSHYYGGGIFERNGVVYTCWGGFIDTGHLRDYADWTIYLYKWLQKNFYMGKTFTFPNQGTKMIRLDLMPPSHKISDQTLIQLAQRITYEYSVWHEIATLFGYSYAPLFFDETVSAFSPEDLYSNLLGTYVAASALQQNAPYGKAVRSEIKKTLKQLIVLDEDETRKVFDLTEGHWWNRQKLISDNELVTRRYLEYGKTMHPWLVPKKIPHCASSSQKPYPLEVPSLDEKGHPLHSYYRLIIRPDKKILSIPFMSENLTSNDFGAVMEKARFHIQKTFGLAGDTSTF